MFATMSYNSLMEKTLLNEELTERVLAGLGLNTRPEPTFEGLRNLYGAWCQKVPFDNVRKLIHVRAVNSGPLPGSTAADFLKGWLRFGAGGTCWAGAGAFHALLVTLGFDVLRGVGTMLVAPDLPPNHGTVVVNFGAEQYVVDCSILHGEPLALRKDSETSIAHPAWGVQCSTRDQRWHIQWRPLHRLDGFECRLETFGASNDEFSESYDRTRGWSPFNYEVTARTNRGERVIGMSFGSEISIERDGSVTQRLISDAERKRVLIEEIGISEELVRHLPNDIPTPPPPGSRKAQFRDLLT
jgi:N-hydroxyarylamine O-acetyltransferase